MDMHSYGYSCLLFIYAYRQKNVGSNDNAMSFLAKENDDSLMTMVYFMLTRRWLEETQARLTT